MSLRPLFLIALFAAASHAASPFAAIQAPPAPMPAVPYDSRSQIPVVIPKVTLPDASKLKLLPAQKMTLTARNSTCYTMRSYEFSQADPPSGIAKLSGVTTCQPAVSGHLRSTILPAPQK